MSVVKQITKKQAEAIIRNSNGKIMTVLFTKRTTGELRLMTCRTGVTKHLKGGVPTYSFEEKKLISVYDMTIGKKDKGEGYRCIPLEGIKEITIDGMNLKVR